MQSFLGADLKRSGKWERKVLCAFQMSPVDNGCTPASFVKGPKCQTSPFAFHPFNGLSARRDIHRRTNTDKTQRLIEIKAQIEIQIQVFHRIQRLKPGCRDIHNILTSLP